MTDNTKTTQRAIHTPGPWEHGDNGLIYGQCGEEDVEAPLVCDVIEDSAMQALGMLSPVEEANARRICAAVKACEGIPTEALEQGAVGELLEALKGCLFALDKNLDGYGPAKAQAIAAATAAIAKATIPAVSASQD